MKNSAGTVLFRVLSGEFQAPESVLQLPLAQCLVSETKKSGIRGLIRTENQDGVVDRTRTGDLLGHTERSDVPKRSQRRSEGNHSTSAGGARMAAGPPSSEARAERRFCAENSVFKAQKTEVRPSAPPHNQDWGGRPDSNRRPPGPQPTAFSAQIDLFIEKCGRNVAFLV